MATYFKVPLSVPSFERTALISSVSAGDRIDVVDVLGRPGRGIKFTMTASTDIIDFKLNNLVRLQQHNESKADTTVLVWSAAPHYSTFRGENKLEHITENGINIDSFEVVALTLSAGTTIDVVVW